MKKSIKNKWKSRLRKAPTTRLKYNTSESFYESAAWKRVRYKVLFSNNGCCELCGRSKRDNGVILHVDHIKSRSTYPSLQLLESNLQVLCGDCNIGKVNLDEVDWRKGRPEVVAKVREIQKKRSKQESNYYKRLNGKH
jgi:5-methylcytosine-specific restriction endonuclease McrA